MKLRALFLAAALGACAPQAMTPLVAESTPDQIRKLHQRLGTEPAIRNALGKPLAFVVSPGQGGARTLVALDLASGQPLWTKSGPISSRVAVGMDLVAHGAEGSLVARDLGTGEVRFQVPVDGTLLGVAADESGVYYAARQGDQRARVVGLSADKGAVRFSHDIEARAGAPVARKGLVFVPLLSQFLVVLDGQSGKELGRILSKEEEISYVRSLPEGVAFGSQSVFTLPGDSATVARGGEHHAQAKLPTDAFKVTYGLDAYSPEQRDYSAFDRNRLLWRLAGGKGAALGEDLALHSFRFLFGFEPKAGHVRWAYAHPRIELVASAHLGAVIAAVAQDGEVVVLDARTGGRYAAARVAGPVLGATFDADGWKPAGAAEAPQPIAGVLAAIVWDRDARFLGAKRFAIEALARLQSPEVTAELIKIVASTELPAQVHAPAADALVARKDPASAGVLVAALGERFDFTRDERPAPVDVIARALGALGAKQAAVALARTLEDPALPSAAIDDVAEALIAMGGKDALPVLRRFLLTYRADPGFAADPKPLFAVLDAIARLGGGEERDLLAFVADEPRTLPPVAQHARQLTIPKPAEAPKK